MPTHWESSERPLFVRTVVVNGSRHAILSHVDPLCQARKSDSSPECLEPIKEDINPRRIRSCYPSKRDISSDLQNCLVKLRVVLSTQEERRRLKKEVLDAKEGEGSHKNWKRLRKKLESTQKGGRDGFIKEEVNKDEITGFGRGNSYRITSHKHECEDNSEDTDSSNKEFNLPEPKIENPVNEVVKMSERMNFVRRILPLSEESEELVQNYSSYFFPIVYIKTDGLIWEDAVGDSVPKKINNPLSERVMQWLDLARRRKESFAIEKSKSATRNQLSAETNHNNTDDKTQNRKNKPVRRLSKGSVIQAQDEDVEGAVKQESDIETVLSSTSTHEYPKYSRELNKLHIMQHNSPRKQIERAFPCHDHWENIVSIPEKTTSDFSLTEQLQQSILESFEAIVNLERKAALERSEKIHSSRKNTYREVRNSSGRTSRKRTLFMKQTTIRISSDEEELPESMLNRQRTHNTGKRSGYFNGKKSRKYRDQKITSANYENVEASDENGCQARFIYNETSLSHAGKNHGGRRIWATEKGANKPHLHIFMPGISPRCLEAHEESTSDAESIVK